MDGILFSRILSNTCANGFDIEIGRKLLIVSVGFLLSLTIGIMCLNIQICW